MLLATLLAVASAELSREFTLPRTIDLASARNALVQGEMHRVLSYKSMKTSRESGRVHVNNYKHPLGGPTVERCEVLKNNANQFQMVVDAASVEAPFGETFTTRVVVTLRRDADNCVVMGATSSVQWNGAKRPPRILEGQIKSAAEKGSVNAYGALARSLEAGGAPVSRNRLRLLRRAVLGVVIGAGALLLRPRAAE
jgi:hypothetical protein